jgi:hypothetical protein
MVGPMLFLVGPAPTISACPAVLTGWYGKAGGFIEVRLSRPERVGELILSSCEFFHFYLTTGKLWSPFELQLNAESDSSGLSLFLAGKAWQAQGCLNRRHFWQAPRVQVIMAPSKRRSAL